MSKSPWTDEGFFFMTGAASNDSPPPLVLWPYCMAYAAIYARFGVIVPFLTLNFLQSGISSGDIGLIYLAIAVPSLFMQQVWGYVADVVLTRRQTLLILLPSAAILFYLFFTPLGLPGLSPLASAIVLGVIYGAFNSPIAQMLNGFVFGSDQASKHFPLLRSVGSCGFIVCTLTLGFAIRYGDLPLITAGYTTLALSLIAMMGIYRAPRHQRRPERHERLGFRQAQRILAGNPRLLGILIFVAFYEIPFGAAYYTMQPMFLDLELKARTDIQVMCTALGALAEIPIFLMGDWLIRRIGAVRCLLFASCFNVIRWLLAYHVTQAYQIVLVSFMHPLTFGLFYFATVRYINLHADSRLRASAQTMLGIIFYGLSTIIGNFIVYWMFEVMMIPLREGFLVMASLSALALIYIMIFRFIDESLDRRAAIPPSSPLKPMSAQTSAHALPLSD